MSCQCQVSDAESYIRCNGGLCLMVTYIHIQKTYTYTYTYTCTYTSERPGNRPSIFINFRVHCDFCLVENLAFATYLYHGGVFWHFISIGIYENSLLYRSGSSKMHVEHPQKTLRFLDGFAFRHSASDSFPSLQLADRLCSDITHISISMYVSPLPSLDICHDHWTLASYLAASFYRPSSNHLLYQYGQAPLGCLAGHGAQSL